MAELRHIIYTNPSSEAMKSEFFGVSNDDSKIFHATWVKS